MAYIRATMIKSSKSSKDAFKRFKGTDAEAVLKAAGAEWIQFVETGDNSVMLVSSYPTKAKANKAWKDAAALRAKNTAENGALFWTIEGPVKWST